VTSGRAAEKKGARRDRAQLLLIGAIVIAIVVVASVVLLNTVHSSPEITADRDAKSLSDVENANNELQNNLEEVFLGTNATDDRKLAYVEGDSFEGVIDSYTEQYNDAVAPDSALVASIDYVDGTEGALAWNESVNTSLRDVQQEEETLLDVEGVDFEDDVPVPTLRLEATLVEEEVALAFVNETDAADEEVKLELDPNNGDGEVTFGGEPLCSFEENASIDLRAGTGTIETDEETCTGVTIEFPDDLEAGTIDDVEDIEKITLQYVPGQVEHISYEVSTKDAECGEPGEWNECVDGVELNPTFAIELKDPSVSYSSTFTVYEDES